MKSLELEQITKIFGTLKANDNISFTFESGKIYAILGENGAGKSTLMKILSGYQSATHGRILLDDKEIEIHTPNDAIHYGIGMLYQDPLDYAPLTVLENFLNGRASGGFLLPRRQAQQELLQICQRLGFSLNPHVLVNTLTVGERQQLEIARLLSLGVQFLILDEPTTGISTERKLQLFDTLKSLAREDNMCIVLVSHKLEDVEALCDEVIVLRRGQLVGHHVLPTPATTLIELMFGKTIEKQSNDSQATEKTLLRVENLAIHARLFSIPAINLDVREGEVIGLAGLDGSGQIEFMQAIAGLARPTRGDHIFSIAVLLIGWVVLGEVLEDSLHLLGLARGLLVLLVAPPLLIALWRIYQQGRQIHQQDTYIQLAQQPIAERGYRELLQQGVVYLPSGRVEEGLVEGLTVMEHVAIASSQRRPWIDWLSFWRRTRQLIQHFNVKGQALDPIQNLSGGNQQRVSLALLPEHLRLILMDNPTRGLDVESAQYIWSLLLARRQDGTSIIFSSPDLDEVLNYSDRIIVFSSGQATLVEDLSKMTSDYLGELIGGKSQ